MGKTRKLTVYRRDKVQPERHISRISAGKVSVLRGFLQKYDLHVVGFAPAEVPPSAAVKFVGAGSAALKMRLQIHAEASAPVGNRSAVKYRGVIGTIITMVRVEGPRSLYSGLVAELQREMSFASVRIGLYDYYVRLGSRLLAGCTTGAMAVVFAQPTDVVKVRLQAQARSSGHVRHYSSTFDAYKTIAK